MDEEFFSNYKKTEGKVRGIPRIQMNKPITENTLVGTIGLELEIEARHALPRDGHLDWATPITNTRWIGVADGSLRGEAREYIFSGPAKREEIKETVERLFKTFETMKSSVMNSNRCSTHVHINMKGRKVNQLTSVIALWGVFEEMLIAWNGIERVTNHFCLSMKNSTSLVESWDSFLRVGNFEGLGQDRHGLKYMAFNILPLWRKGSFEFRCGGSPNEPTRVTTWAVFLDKLCEYACTRYTSPPVLASDLSERGGYAILEEICGEELQDFLGEVVGDSIEAFNEKCLDGFRVVQPLVLGYPWEAWLPLIEREFVPDPFAKKKKAYGDEAPRGIRLTRGIVPEDRAAEVGRLPEWVRATETAAQERTIRNMVAVEAERTTRIPPAAPPAAQPLQGRTVNARGTGAGTFTL